MNGTRQINIKARIDHGDAAQDARQASENIWKELKDDRGAFAALKAKIDKLVSDFTTSGGKLKVPVEQIAAAARATGVALDKLAQEQADKLSQLYPYLDRLKTKMSEAWKNGDDATYGQSRNKAEAIEREIAAREKLVKQAQEQWVALEKLVGVEVMEGKAIPQAAQEQKTLSQQLSETKKKMDELTQAGKTTTEEYANLQTKARELAAAIKQLNQDSTAPQQKTLQQQLAETKKKMDELAQAGKANTKEYTDLKNKARELSEAIKKLNQDSSPDQQVRFRTALMNVKNEMIKLKKEGKENTEQYRQLQQEAIKLQQAMNAANKQIKNMANPNATFQGMISGLSAVSGGFSVATGAMALFGEKNEDVQKIMMKLQAVMSITMGLQSINTALNKNSAFQLNIVGRLTNWWAACKAKAATSIAAETTAIGANTAAVGRATVANSAHAVSWRAVGIAMKSVPILGWIIALGTLAAAVYKVFKSYNYAKEAKKELHKATLNANKSAAEEITTLKTLYSVTQNQALSMEKRRIAANKMQDLYPDVFRNLKTEAILAGDAAQAYRELTQAILNKAKAEARRDRIKQIEQQSLDNETEFRKEAEEWVRKYNEAAGGVSALSVEGIISMGGLPDLFSTEGKPSLAIAERSLRILVDTYLKPNRERAKEEERLIREIGELEPTSHDEERASGVGQYATDPKYYQRMMREAEEKAEDRKYTEAERTQAQKDYYMWREKYKQATAWKTERTTAAGRADVAEQKVEDATISALRARAKAILKIEQDLEQRRIDILQDGAEKRMRQRKLDAEKEMDDLYGKMQQEVEAEVNRQKQIWDAREEANAREAAAKGRQYRKKAFSSGEVLTADLNPGITLGTGDNQLNIGLGNVGSAEINLILSKYGVMQDLLLKQQQKRIDDETKADRQAMDEYLMQYGSLQEKKAAIDRIYAEKKKKAANVGEEMKIQQEWNEALNNVEFEDFVQNRAALAFGEIENLSRETIDTLIDELEKYRSKVVETFDPDKIKKYNQALADLRKTRAMGNDNPLSVFTPEYFRKRKAAQEEINALQETSNDLLQQKADKEQEVKQKIEEIIAKVRELTGEELTAAQVTDGSTVQRIINNLHTSGKTNEANALQGMNSDLGTAQVQLNNVTQASDQTATSLSQLGEAFKANFSGAQGSIAQVDAIIHTINDNVQALKGTIDELASTAEALGGDTSVGSGWDKATTLMGAFSEASQGATDAWESLKSGNVMGVVQGVTKSITSWIKGFAALHDASRERTIQRLQKQIDELERINRRIDHDLKNQYSKQASKSYKDEIKNLEQQRRLIQQQIAEEEDKKNSDDDRIQEWKDKLEELGWKIEEYKQAALDAILGEDIKTSIDNFADLLVDSWGKMGNRAQEVKNFVKTLLKQMVIEAMKTDLSEPIAKLRQMMADALANDVVTAAEQAAIEQYAQEIGKATAYKYEWADKILDDATKGQSGGTKGGYDIASQDSVNEWNGRLAAVHTTLEMSRQLQMSMDLKIAAALERLNIDGSNLEDTRNLVLIAVGHLETIAKNTKELYEINERLQQIERNTDRL